MERAPPSPTYDLVYDIEKHAEGEQGVEAKVEGVDHVRLPCGLEPVHDRLGLVEELHRLCLGKVTLGNCVGKVFGTRQNI